MAPSGMARAPISRCSPPTRPRWKCACSIAAGQRELERIALPEYTDQIWHGYIPDVASRRGLWSSGPRALRARGRPSLQSQQAAARPLCPRPTSASSNGPRSASATRIGAAGEDLSFDERDSAPFVPKCVVVDPNFDWKGQPRIARGAVGPDDHLRGHVKGFTKLHPAVPEQQRGTYAGLGTQGGRRLRQVAGRDLHRAAADPHLHQRQPSARAEA